MEVVGTLLFSVAYFGLVVYTAIVGHRSKRGR